LSIILSNIETQFFSNLNLHLRKNEKIAIIGENGVGKTTLLRTILGLFSYSGEMEILNTKISSQKDFEKLYENIGYLFQDSDDSFIASSVLEEVAFNLYNKIEDLDIATQTALDLLEEFNILSLKDKVPIKLSGGQKRIVALCAILIHSPKILLLDEPTNHLDKKFTALIEKKLQDFDGNIILIAHDINFAKRIVSKVYELSNTGLKEVDI